MLIFREEGSLTESSSKDDSNWSSLRSCQLNGSPSRIGRFFPVRRRRYRNLFRHLWERTSLKSSWVVTREILLVPMGSRSLFFCPLSLC